MSLQWFLVDGLGPFFESFDATGAREEPLRRWNWSKVPFTDLECGGSLAAARRSSIVRDFQTLCERVAQIGFNAVTLDDVAHMVPWEGYSPALARKLALYGDLYDELIDLAGQSGLAVFVTSDILYLNPDIERELPSRELRLQWFRSQVDRLLGERQGVEGVIFRFGESDGRDVRGDFRSDLTLRTPRQARAFLSALLPSFELRDRLLIFRTWSVGAYPLGDLMWNRDTFDQVFESIHSPNLCLSMKYGESDFFRYLPLNRHFFRSDHQKLVELQARREYEGFGEYPSFVGWSYERYRDQLESARNMIGISVWCQTGGWSKFGRRTYLEGSSYWNELNTEVTLDLFRRGDSTEVAVERFVSRRSEIRAGIPSLLALLRLSDEVMSELLYIDEAARRKMFFRRLRLPPLFHVYWDNILINHPVRKILRTLVGDGELAVEQGFSGLSKIDRMVELAPCAQLPIEDLLFQRDTFEILAHARRYYFQRFENGIRDDLVELKESYEQRWRRGYSIHLSFRPLRLKRKALGRGLDLLLREQRGYRRVDHLVTLRLLAIFYPLLRPFLSRIVPDFAREETMGIGTVLR